MWPDLSCILSKALTSLRERGGGGGSWHLVEVPTECERSCDVCPNRTFVLLVCMYMGVSVCVCVCVCVCVFLYVCLFLVGGIICECICV